MATTFADYEMSDEEMDTILFSDDEENIEFDAYYFADENGVFASRYVESQNRLLPMQEEKDDIVYMPTPDDYVPFPDRNTYESDDEYDDSIIVGAVSDTVPVVAVGKVELPIEGGVYDLLKPSRKFAMV